MTQVRVREVIGTMRVMDGESFLSGALMDRLITAVLEALRTDQRDEAARRRDTRIGECACEGVGSKGERQS